VRAGVIGLGIVVLVVGFILMNYGESIAIRVGSAHAEWVYRQPYKEIGFFVMLGGIVIAGVGVAIPGPRRRMMKERVFFDRPVSRPIDRPIQPPASGKYCMYCGTLNSSDSFFCKACGKSFPSSTTSKEPSF